MKLLTKYFIFCVSAFYFSTSWAGDLTIPNSFSAGTPAVAAEVNANFDAVETEVDDNDLRILDVESDLSDNILNIADHESRVQALESFTKNGMLHSLPTSCQRGSNGGDPHADTRVYNPPGNFYGPSIAESSGADGIYHWYCDVPLQVPAGTTLTLTGATLAFYDGSVTCLIGARIKHKTFGTSSTGDVASTIYSGASNSDYAYTSSGPDSKSFPTFSLVVPESTIVFVEAEIRNTGGTAGDCRYTGVQLEYSINQ